LIFNAGDAGDVQHRQVGIRGVVVVSRCLLAFSGGLGQSLAVSGKPKLTVEADGPCMDSFVPVEGITDGPTPFDRWLRCRWSEARSGIAGMQSGGLHGMPS